MSREALQEILRRAESEPSFVQEFYHNPGGVFARYHCTDEEKRAILSGSVSTIEEHCGWHLNPRLAALLEKYRWEGSCERRQAIMRESDAHAGGPTIRERS